MSSHDVTPLQTALAAKGYDLGVIDGIFGAKTLAAMQAYEGALNLAISSQPTHEVCDSLGITLAPDFPYQPVAPKRTTILNTVIQNIGANAADYFFNFITSKINGVAIIAAGAVATLLSTRFGLNLSDSQVAWVAAEITLGANALIVVLRTFFNKPKVVTAVPLVITTKGASK